MKHGTKPSRYQRRTIEEHGLNAMDWLVTKDTPELMELVHRYSDTTKKTIYKEWK